MPKAAEEALLTWTPYAVIQCVKERAGQWQRQPYHSPRKRLWHVEIPRLRPDTRVTRLTPGETVPQLKKKLIKLLPYTGRGRS